MLFPKTEGNSLELTDWIARSSERHNSSGSDLLGAAANSLWKAIRTGDPSLRASHPASREEGAGNGFKLESHEPVESRRVLTNK
jgi:hypothetical protein